MEKEFWKHWFEAELANKKNLTMNMEDFYFTILLEMSSMMKDLNIDIKIIIYCLVETIAADVIRINGSLLRELELTLIKQNQHKNK